MPLSARVGMKDALVVYEYDYVFACLEACYASGVRLLFRHSLIRYMCLTYIHVVPGRLLDKVIAHLVFDFGHPETLSSPDLAPAGAGSRRR